MNKKLVPPCSYQGGKQRLSSKIVDIIFEQNEIDEDTKFYDLCCGSGAISLELVNRGIKPSNITMVDVSPWGKLYKMIGNETFDMAKFKEFIDTIPKDITKIKEKALDILSRNVEEDMMIYHFLFLQSCAFGSTATWVEDNKWCKASGLRDYWLPTETSNRRSPVNPMKPMPNTLYQRVEDIVEQLGGRITASQESVFNTIYKLDEEWESGNDNVIIYIDPPYMNTIGYKESFDIYELERQIWTNSPIYISEGFKMEGVENAWLLSEGRTKGNISGNVKKKPVEEWLNKY